MFEDFQDQRDDIFEELEDKNELLLNAASEQTMVDTEPKPEIYGEIRVEQLENELGISTFASFNSLEDMNVDIVDELLSIPNVEFDFTYNPENRSYENAVDNSGNIVEPDTIENTQDNQQITTSEYMKVNIVDKLDIELSEKLDPELLEDGEPSNLSELEGQWSDQQSFPETREGRVEIEEDTHLEPDNLETGNYIERDYIDVEKDELTEDLIDELLENIPDEFSTPFPLEEDSIQENTLTDQAEEYTESTIMHHANQLIDTPDEIADINETELVIEEFLLENKEDILENEYKSLTLVEEEKVRHEREWREELVEERHTPPHFSEYMMSTEEKDADDNEELEEEDGDTDEEDIEEAENSDPDPEEEKEVTEPYRSGGPWRKVLKYPYESNIPLIRTPSRPILSYSIFPSPSTKSNAMYSYFPPPQSDAHQGHAKSTTDNNSKQKRQYYKYKIPEDNNSIVVNADVKDKYSKHFQTKLEKFEQGISNARINKLIFKEDVLKPFWKDNKKSRQNLQSYWKRLLKDNINGLKKLPPFDLTDPNTWPTGVRNKYQELVKNSSRSISDWKKLKQFEIDISYAINKANIDSIVSDILELGFDIGSDPAMYQYINDIYVQIDHVKSLIQEKVDDVSSLVSISKDGINGLEMALPSGTVGDLAELEGLISTILRTRDELLELTGNTKSEELTSYITARTAHGFSHVNGLDGIITINMDIFYKDFKLGTNPGPKWKIIPIEAKFRTMQENLDLRGLLYIKGRGMINLKDDGLNKPSLLNGEDIVTKTQRLFATMNQLGSNELLFDTIDELRDFLRVYEQHFDRNLRYNTILRSTKHVAKSPIMYYYKDGDKYIFKHIETKAMKAKLKIPFWDIHKPNKPKYTAAQQEKDGNTIWDNATEKMEDLTSRNIEIHAFPEGIFTVKGNKVHWDLNRLRDLNADTLNELQVPYIKNIDQLEIKGLSKKYRVIRRVELDVEMPADMKTGISKNQVYYKMKDGKRKVMKFIRGKVDLLELDISIAEYYEMIQNGDFEKIRAAIPSIIIFPNKTINGRLLSISEKQRLMEDSMDIIKGEYHINLRTNSGISQVSIGKTVDPVSKLEGILCGNYANDGFQKQIYFQTTFESTVHDIEFAHHLHDARELYNNKIHRKNELLGIHGGETKVKDEGKSISKIVLDNIQTYFADEVDRQIEALNAEIKRIKGELNVNKTLIYLSSEEVKDYNRQMKRYKTSKNVLYDYNKIIIKILVKNILETRRYKIATENVLRENISAFERSLENQYVKMRLDDPNQHRLIWDNSGLGIDLPTNMVDEYTITTGNSLEHFFASSVLTIANLNELLGTDGKAMKNGGISELIKQGKIIVIPARKLDTRETGSIMSGPFILVEDRVLIPNYKLNPDGSQKLVNFRNEPLFSIDVNSEGVSFKFMKKFGEDILFSNRVTLKGVSLGKILEGGGVPSYRRQAEEKISSIPNWNYKSLSVDANQSQKDIQKIFTDHIFLMDQKNRLNYLETLSYDEWAKKIERFISIDQKPDKVTLPEALVPNIFSNARKTLRRSVLDRTSVDLLNIRILKERLDKLAKSGILKKKIVLPEKDEKGKMVLRERTILEIYQRSLVSALFGQKTSAGFMKVLATLNLWGQADKIRIAADVANLPVELKDKTFINVRGSYDVNTDKLSIHTLSTRNLIMQDGKKEAIINQGWIPLEDTDLNINKINRFEFSAGSELSLRDAFNSEFALLDRIKDHSATVSEVLDSIIGQLSFFGFDKKGNYENSSKFKDWFTENGEQWALLGQDAPNKLLKEIPHILRGEDNIDYLAFRLKMQLDILRGLVGLEKYEARFLRIDGYSASFFARLSS